jgi:hypothetical protein
MSGVGVLTKAFLEEVQCKEGISSALGTLSFTPYELILNYLFPFHHLQFPQLLHKLDIWVTLALTKLLEDLGSHLCSC